MGTQQILLIFRTIFDEEIAKLTFLFKRHKPEDYEEYKRIRCRLVFLVELFMRIGSYSSVDTALFWLTQHRNQHELENIFKQDPFHPDTKEKLYWEQLWFCFQARACAR